MVFKYFWTPRRSIQGQAKYGSQVAGVRVRERIYYKALPGREKKERNPEERSPRHWLFFFQRGLFCLFMC
jgi:hypothetical protein